MSKTIRLYMEDWLYNSGIVGIYNILNKAEDNLVLDENYLEFDLELLEGFETKYFNYFIEKYEESISWYRIVSFKDFIIYHKETNFEEFNEGSLEQLNKYITDIVKRYVKSNSYKSAYELIGVDFDILSLEKKLSAIRLKKKEKIEDVITRVKETFNILNEIVSYMELEDTKKYIGAKNVIYTIIKNSWDGVSILNPQTKEKDMYIDYAKYFIDPVKEYITEDKSKYKYNCFICDSKIKDLKNNLSFLNATGFDVNKKSSHVWEFNNDVATCPICRLIYSCSAAGFTYMYDKGIYVNDNSTIRNAIDVNNKISREILRDHDVNRSLTYRALIKSIQDEFRKNVKYELVDIQVVRYDGGRYTFNILAKNMLKVIKDSKDNLNTLVTGSYKEINTYFNIYDIVIDSLLNNQNLNLIIHKLLRYKLSIPSNCFYNGRQILNTIKINDKFMRGLGYMDKLQEKAVDIANKQGYFLRQEYKEKGSEGKLNGIAYRLLNALKINSKDMFMDTILNCYLYVQKTVPPILLEGLKDDIAFKTVGYAYVSGLIEGKAIDKEGGKTNEK